MLEKVKFQYSPLGEALKNNAKTKTDKIVKKGKGDKHLVYNQQHSFAKFKDINDFKKMSLDSMYKRLSEFHKKITRSKSVNPQIDANSDLKVKVLDNAMLEIFSMKCITFTKKNNKKKKML